MVFGPPSTREQIARSELKAVSLEARRRTVEEMFGPDGVRAVAAAIAGRIFDKSEFGNYANVVGQSYAVRALSLAEDGRRGATRLAQMLEHPERTINAVTLVVFAVQVITANLVGILIARFFGTWGRVGGIVLNVVVFFVFAEAAPKTWAVQHADRAALRTSGFLWFLTEFPPVRWIVRGLLVMRSWTCCSSRLAPRTRRRRRSSSGSGPVSSSALSSGPFLIAEFVA